MRVAIHAESAADAAAIRVLIEAILGQPTTDPNPSIRTGGWPLAHQLLPAAIKHLYYRTDADGLVVVVDSNHSSIVDDNPSNRLTLVKNIIAKEIGHLKSGSRPPLRTAVGVAVPAIEAWLLCAGWADLNEAAWEKGLKENRQPYSKSELKKRLYGNDRPSFHEEKSKMLEAAHRLDLRVLRDRFPLGFGSLEADLIAWRSVTK